MGLGWPVLPERVARACPSAPVIAQQDRRRQMLCFRQKRGERARQRLCVRPKGERFGHAAAETEVI